MTDLTKRLAEMMASHLSAAAEPEGYGPFQPEEFEAHAEAIAPAVRELIEAAQVFRWDPSVKNRERLGKALAAFTE